MTRFNLCHIFWCAFSYDVEIRLATRSVTDVEYNWKFYRDHNGNGIIMDNPGADDGYKANNGDITNLPTSNPADPMVNPAPDNDWGYDAPYYFKVILTYHPGVSYP